MQRILSSPRRGGSFLAARLGAGVVLLGLALVVASAAPARSTAQPPPTTVSGSTGAKTRPATPSAPDVVLYDQYDNDGQNAVVSQNRSDLPSLNAQIADDFVVPAGQRWAINEVAVREGGPGFHNATSFNVFFYANTTSNLPGALFASRSNLAYTGNPDLTIPLGSAVPLNPGTYWVSVQANTTGAQWYWEMRSVQSNSPAALQEAGGYGTGCNAPAWFNRGTCTGTTNTPDQMFRLVGTGNEAQPPTPTNYLVAVTANNVIVPGTTDIGNHCDDCTTPITLPFAFDLYGVTHSAVVVSSNGNIQFTGNSAYLGTSCPLPDPNLGRAMMVYQDDLLTSITGTGSDPTNGIFTSISGVAPNRIFNIEWRTTYFGHAGKANFEARLYEGQSKFQYEYGATADNGSGEESGVQWSASDATYKTQFSCRTATLTPGTTLTFTRAPTAVRVTDFGVSSSTRGVRLHWRIAAASDVLGFQVWRQRGSGPLRKATAALLPAKPGARPASYSFLDSRARSAGRYRYRLRVVTLSGARYWAGVTTARVLG